jgi:hypothetical protein
MSSPRHDAASHDFRKSNLDFFIPPPHATYDSRRQDIEQRLLFAGCRFTKVNGLLAGLLALFCTGATYSLLLLIQQGPTRRDLPAAVTDTVRHRLSVLVVADHVVSQMAETQPAAPVARHVAVAHRRTTRPLGP